MFNVFAVLKARLSISDSKVEELKRENTGKLQKSLKSKITYNVNNKKQI